MGKYEPLTEFLKDASQNEVRMSFDEIEKIIGRQLPSSARRHRAWWSNNPENSVMTKAWLDAGWKSEQVDMEARKLVFRRMRKNDADEPPTPGKPTLYGALKGIVRIAPGTDLIQPTGVRWSAQGDLDDE